MTKTAMTVALLGLAWLAAPLGLLPDGPLGGLAWLCLSLGLATLLHGRWTLLGVSSAALGALVWVALSPAWPGLAGALWLSAMMAPRTWRASSRAAHGAVALVGGALAAWVASRWGAQPDATVRAAAWAVAGMLSLASWALPADDAVAFELTRLASQVPEPAAARLKSAAALRRRATDDDEVLGSLPPSTRALVAQGWGALADAAALRARLGAAVAERAQGLDARIERQLAVLERIQSAAESRHARALGATDLRLVTAELERDGLEAEAQALNELSNELHGARAS